MPSVDTMIGNEFRFAIMSVTSPGEFIDFCAVTDPGAIGEEKPLIDVTALCDAGRVYRGGLRDGVEIPLVVNFIQGDPQIRQMYQLYQADDQHTFRLYIPGTSPEEFFQFDAIVRAWNLGVPNGDKASMTFTLKVNGSVNWVYAP
jgi:hypothetical protein